MPIALGTVISAVASGSAKYKKLKRNEMKKKLNEKSLVNYLVLNMVCLKIL
jgi:hypothetical protein